VDGRALASVDTLHISLSCTFDCFENPLQHRTVIAPGVYLLGDRQCYRRQGDEGKAFEFGEFEHFHLRRPWVRSRRRINVRENYPGGKSLVAPVINGVLIKSLMDRRALLFHLAEDAFDVLNWARREGRKRDKQLEQVVEAYEKTLTDNKATLDLK
jgi:hypothetical protein